MSEEDVNKEGDVEEEEEEEEKEEDGGCWILSRRRRRDTLERPRVREPEKSILESLDFALVAGWAEAEGGEGQEEEAVGEEGGDDDDDDGEGKDIFHQMKTRPKVLRGTW